MQEIILTIFSSSSRQLYPFSHPPGAAASIQVQCTRNRHAIKRQPLLFILYMPVCVCLCVRILLYREFFGLPAVLLFDVAATAEAQQHQSLYAFW